MSVSTMPLAPVPTALVAGRGCDGCTMCCKLMWVETLAKPRQRWCPHCRIGEGCAIYESRPGECRTFFCSFLTEARLGDHWAPKLSRMVVTYRADQRQLTIHVDADRRDAWRRAPYHEEIAAWARATATEGGQVLVRQGLDLIALLPDHEVMLGPVPDGWQVLTLHRDGPQGRIWDALALPPDDPRIAEIRQR